MDLLITKMYAVDRSSGKITEFTKNWVKFEFGIIININQKGANDKLDQKYIFSIVKYVVN
jgi:hypothetical protein